MADNQHILTTSERVISSVAGGALAAWGIARRDWAGLAMAIGGGALLFRGSTGYCPVEGRLKHQIGSIQGEIKRSGMFHLDRSITVDRSPDEVYNFWRGFKHLPKFLESEVVNERPGQYIEWRSPEGVGVESRGIVRFKRKRGDRGTKIHVTLDYRTPFGATGEAVARWVGRSPELQIDETLHQLKEALEAA